jgi:maltose alpha-D-glucosyltransferase/alpha-amylase
VAAPWYRDVVIYEVYVRGFYDSNADGIGDLPGLTEKLDYIRDLGVGALWLLPIYPSPLRDDGYDVSDYRAVHPDLGTMDDLRRLLDRAHKIGLRVLLDLVLNHTSDQHPWFRSARLGPGSPYHDYYVWSPTPDRYPDARVIFTSSHQANWTRVPETGLYYWHRFYPHQPDLNFDNPAVGREIEEVARFWLDQGVDGLRLDAAPYLFEREGTPCENLPETHAFLKRLRTVTDGYDPPRVLLVEANQPPEALARYFGDGDEVHMAFQFPAMPRLFMAIRNERAEPLARILATVSNIPANCQWAYFLRNHDELTLEMVTEAERTYLLETLAVDARMRINAGIRRRLWPLMLGGRRQIELLHGLIVSLPGVAVLYYGDELGMGDDVRLGDRMGVRTPMQWSAGPNAGFSTAPADRLYAPVITEPEYHYAGHNVESLDQKPTSFLNWLRRMIKVHRLDPIFRGESMRILETPNPAIFAMIRRHEDLAMLCVFNLSRFVQPVSIDLAEWSGRVPVDAMGGAAFPPIGSPPYFLSLGPHGFYWLRLERRTPSGS